MANELTIDYPTGATLYVLLFDATGQIWNGAAFAAPGSASWTDYDIAMTEAATATGLYQATMPAVAAGVYGWVVRRQAGAGPAVGDIRVGNGTIEWNGTAEVSLTSRATQASVDDVPTVAEFNARTLVSADYVVVSDLPAAPDNASIAAILEDTGTTLDTLIKDLPTNAELATALATADDAVLAAIAVVGANVDAALADTGELQTDWADGGRLDLLLDAAAVSNGLDAAGVRAAVGLAAADLDAQLGDIQSTVDQLDDIFIYTLTTDGTTPIRDALVQAFSDEAMTTIVDYGITDYYGKVRLHLKEPGTYYLHRTKVGISFVNPDNETIP